MFCIAAFIVLLIISIFSARYRRLAKKAWGCTVRRVTFRPCDTSFKEELKGKMLSKVALKTPRLVKTADIGIEVASFIIVILTIWSLLVVVKSGLNLYVYGTCNPSNAASCSLGAESCSIETATPSFWTSVKTFKVQNWVGNEAKNFGKTIEAIPTRIQKWQATDYLPANVTYLNKYDPTKPTALEIIDPGCSVCQQLYRNIEQADFANRYNLAYIAYPIKGQGDSYKFKNSLVVAQYLEAVRQLPLAGSDRPVDWKILDRIFTGTDSQGVNWQVKINTLLNNDQTRQLLDGWLKEFGYSDDQITQIQQTAGSSTVANTINTNRQIVEKKIKTVKIPTIIFNGHRHDGLVDVKGLK